MAWILIIQLPHVFFLSNQKHNEIQEVAILLAKILHTLTSNILDYFYCLRELISFCLYLYSRKMTFRSIQMAHFRLFLPRQNFYHSVEELLSLGNSHIIDIGSPLNRPFFNQLKRIDDLLHKVHTLTEALKQKQLSFEQYDQSEPNFMASLQMLWRRQAQKLGKEDSKLIDHYDAEITEQWERYMDKKNSLQRLKGNQKSVLSKIACFEALNTFFGEGRMVGQLNLGGNNGISAMVGVVEPSLELKLQRTIYRISRGFAYFKTVENFAFQGLRNFHDKVIILIYPNSSSGVLQKKLARVMETFTTSLIQFRQGQQTTQEMKNCRRQYEEANNLIELNQKELNKYLDSIRNRHSIQTWRIFLWKQHLIYDTLNKMLLKDHFLVADVYLPQSQKAKLQIRISTISPTPQMQELPVIKPPTAFDTNCYTIIAQQITDTYGVPRYQEMNPAIFTTVTFPFFFGVMFGDMGHGLILLLFGLYLVLNNDVLKKTSFSFLSSLRYMVLMMGFFAFYCGWIYNDFLGMNLNIFGSCYDPTKALTDKDNYLEPHPDCIYPFGIDPIWGKAGNQLVFVNSLKMKIAVIIAIVHMSVGVVIKYFNARFFKRKLEVVFQFIPQILFLGLLFGYMDFLIIYKWLTNWGCVVRIDPITGAQGIACQQNHMPPSIISTMMDIGLKVGSTLDSKAMWGEAGASSQDTIQVILLLIAVLSIPIMLFPKPCIEIRKHKKVHKDYPLLAEQLQNQRQIKVNESEDNSHYDKPQKSNYFKQEEPKEEEHDSSEIFVHQLIQTIEFVLGAISNTASYLRLWALSLAHSQLAKVFFQKTLQYGFTGGAYLGLVAMPVLFYILVWVTFGVLMCMDTMQCFLHSLRLHWVEFQNKFYKGDGYKYQPVQFRSFITLMKQESVK